jgi:hypothetical protein
VYRYFEKIKISKPVVVILFSLIQQSNHHIEALIDWHLGGLLNKVGKIVMNFLLKNGLLL